MPKKIKFESFKYRFLITCREFSHFAAGGGCATWDELINSLDFTLQDNEVCVSWQLANPGSIVCALSDAKFYTRGDTAQSAAQQRTMGLDQAEDPIKLKNHLYFHDAVMKMATLAGFKNMTTALSSDARLHAEREFHDAWANSEDLGRIDIRAANEACTAPEMRYITKRLGDIRGKRLLDVGCGLGEASVYFALLGANVTSSDLSQGMLDATCRLAAAHNVSVTPHLAAAENMQLADDAQFDIIYAGNLLHHVNIDETLQRIKPHLAPDGMLVTWDPLAYNPAINVYRAIATDVRTPDEHPLKWQDIKLFHKHFSHVETKYFWLTTLVIFLIMALVQRRNPNKERFWKVIVQEGHRWRWLYSPLEKLDKVLITLVPPLRLLCWNTVIVAKQK